MILLSRTGNALEPGKSLKKTLAVFSALIMMVGISLTHQPAFGAEERTAPALPGGTPVLDRDYIAFRDASDPLFRDTLWIQDLTECREDPEECKYSGKGLSSKSYQVAYCLNQASSMPYDGETHKDMKYDKETGLWSGAQKYWRYEPSDQLIKNFVKENAGEDANLRAIKKVLYYGYHDADDSDWQREHGITDIQFREGTQYALWHYTDKLDPYSTRGWTWPIENVKKVYDYLVDKENRLADAPIDFKVNFFHTDEVSQSDDGKYQNLVSVRTIPTPEEPKPNKPEPKRTRVIFKKVDGYNSPLAGVKIRVYAKSKLAGDNSILFDKTLELTNDEHAVLEELETDVTYLIEEIEAPGGYTKRSFEMRVDKNGTISFQGENAAFALVETGSTTESDFRSETTVTLKNTLEAPDGAAAELATTVHAGTAHGDQHNPANVSAGRTRVSDSVRYRGFVPDTYTFTARLMKIVNGKANTEVKKVTKEVQISAGHDAGSVEMDFGEVDLEAGARYVVFEKAESQNPVILRAGAEEKTKLVVTHENPDDKAQTIVVRAEGEMSLKTTVQVGTNKASADQALEQVVDEAQLTSGITIRDNVSYSGLDADTDYKLIGVLNKVENEKVTPIASSISQSFRPNRLNLMYLEFAQVKGLEPDQKYVVYEYLFKATDELETRPGDTNIANGDRVKARAKHENPEDNAQTVVFKKETPMELATTVKVGKESASEAAPLTKYVLADDINYGYSLVDTVSYRGLKAEESYKLVAVVNKVEHGAVTPIRSFVSASFMPDESGRYDFELNLQPFDLTVEADQEHRYVVYEYLFKADQPLETEHEVEGGIKEKDRENALAKHENPDDKAQTLVLREKTYTPTQAEIKVKKILQGRAFQSGDEFEFTLSSSEYTPMPTKRSLKVTNEQEVSFGKINFTAPGNYSYTITETKGKIAGITYAKDPVTVSIEVTETEGTQLKATVKYPQQKTVAEIINTYDDPTPPSPPSPPVPPVPGVPDRPGDPDPDEPNRPDDPDPDPDRPDRPDEPEPDDPTPPSPPSPPVPPVPGVPDRPGDPDPDRPDRPDEPEPDDPTPPSPPSPPVPPVPGVPDRPGDPDPDEPNRPDDPDPDRPDRPDEPEPEQPNQPGEPEPPLPTPPTPSGPGKPEPPRGENLAATGTNAGKVGSTSLIATVLGMLWIWGARLFRKNRGAKS